MLRQAIKEETPLILQTATEATLNAGTSSSSLAIGNMAANAARTAAVASVEAASSTTATGLGRMGAEVVSREAAGVMGGEQCFFVFHAVMVARLTGSVYQKQVCSHRISRLSNKQHRTQTSAH